MACAETHAARGAASSDAEAAGDSRRLQEAEDMIGAVVRDSCGREWRVVSVGVKDGFPTICGEAYWDRPDDVEVVRHDF